ncbi:ankyrin repeat domain-containing protein 34A-like isoform X2 [Betta splendens]|nr:ankyrin repeat domain-containing protein 34A-like isoform X2 [Betta splendens]XP_055361845.1 ankyrin repeat domain-containing protein 34A-like isoform X2 [Betta splendens]
MYACMERAGARVASVLLAAGADPSMEDRSGASALVYAVNAQHQPTLKVLMDACRARGHDVIIIATETGASGGPVTRRYLNVPPSPDTSPVSCMSPSDIVLKTSSPNSPEGENVFNFRGTSKRGGGSCSSRAPREPSLDPCNAPPPRQRMLSDPRLVIHSLARLHRAYEQGLQARSQQHDSNTEDLGDSEHREDEESRLHPSKMAESREGFLPGVSPSRTLAEAEPSRTTSGRLMPKRCVTPGSSAPPKSSVKLPACPPPHAQRRRNTLPSVTVPPPPPLHLPPLVDQSESHLQVASKRLPSKSRSMVFLPHPPPPSSSRASSSSSSSSSSPPSLQPVLPISSSVTSLVTPPAAWCRESNRKSLRRHSVQLE